ncbi:hypothetical protein LDENG_00201320 [Lucifuga dentata]|nr:hypothetical protein LDENG_00201320 [Lucifuga dentata]
MVFIMACAAILVATFSFITVIACRPRYYKPQVVASSNAIFMKNDDTDGSSNIHFSFCNVERGERQPLLSSRGTQSSS